MADQPVPDSDEELLGQGQSQAMGSNLGNPFPAPSPAGSPNAVDPGRILEQLAATTQLLSNIVIQQQSQASAPSASGSSSFAGFSDANKVLNRPSEFGTMSHDQDVTAWQDWSHSFRSWLVFADGEYERILRVVEEHLDSPISIAHESAEIRVRTQSLEVSSSIVLGHC